MNLLNFSLKKAFIYLNVFINIYLMEIMALIGFYLKINLKNRRRKMSDNIQEKKFDEVYCASCGKAIKAQAELCPFCGVR